jgi:hypothetical protein
MPYGHNDFTVNEKKMTINIRVVNVPERFSISFYGDDGVFIKEIRFSSSDSMFNSMIELSKQLELEATYYRYAEIGFTLCANEYRTETKHTFIKDVSSHKLLRNTSPPNEIVNTLIKEYLEENGVKNFGNYKNNKILFS